jgi:hypothetical protein
MNDKLVTKYAVKLVHRPGYTIDLDHIPYDDFIPLCNALHNDTTVISLGIGPIHVTPENTFAIVNLIENTASLKAVGIKWGDIKDHYIKEIYQALSRNTSIEHIYFDFCTGGSKDGSVAAIECLLNNKTLTHCIFPQKFFTPEQLHIFIDIMCESKQYRILQLVDYFHVNQEHFLKAFMHLVKPDCMIEHFMLNTVNLDTGMMHFYLCGLLKWNKSIQRLDLLYMTRSMIFLQGSGDC